MMAAMVRVTLVQSATIMTGTFEGLGQFRGRTTADHILAVIETAIAFEQGKVGANPRPEQILQIFEDNKKGSRFDVVLWLARLSHFASM
jgi:hypothetical protein